jgi:hypothetical protein
MYYVSHLSISEIRVIAHVFLVKEGRRLCKRTECKGLRSGSYCTGILELYSIEKRTTGS